MKRLARWLVFNQRYAWAALAAWNLLAAVGTQGGPLMRLFFVAFGAFYTVCTVKTWSFVSVGASRRPAAPQADEGV